jgi:hypothetical protein
MTALALALLAAAWLAAGIHLIGRDVPPDGPLSTVAHVGIIALSGALCVGLTVAAVLVAT